MKILGIRAVMLLYSSRKDVWFHRIPINFFHFNCYWLTHLFAQCLIMTHRSSLSLTTDRIKNEHVLLSNYFCANSNAIEVKPKCILASRETKIKANAKLQSYAYLVSCPWLWSWRRSGSFATFTSMLLFLLVLGFSLLFVFILLTPSFFFSASIAFGVAARVTWLFWIYQLLGIWSAVLFWKQCILAIAIRSTCLLRKKITF